MQRTLFGSLVHLWIFDRQCKQPDKANARALSIFHKGASNASERLWRQVQDACPLPLLDHWKDTVLDLLRSTARLTQLSYVIGELEAYRISLDVPVLSEAIGELIRNGTLDTVPRESGAATPLRLVA